MQFWTNMHCNIRMMKTLKQSDGIKISFDEINIDYFIFNVSI